MLPLFRITYRLYALAIRLVSPFNPKAKEWSRGRSRIREDLKGIESHSILWFHAASLGEYEMGKPTMIKLKEAFPEKKLLVTFFSPSGYLHKKDDSTHDFACYLPHDTTKQVQDFLNLVNPEMAVFIKYDFWPTLLKECITKRIPTSVISATFRKKQFVFSSLGLSIRKLLHQFDLIAVQDSRSKELLLSKGFTNVELTGDGRFDNVSQLSKGEFENEYLKAFCSERQTFFGGSIWEEDEEMILPQIMRHPYLNFVLAPHDVSEGNVHRLANRIPAPFVKLSEVSSETNLEDIRVLIIDSIGLLSRAYRLGSFAFVGGGYKTGLHNILEPAVYEQPVFFGPQHEKFWEAEALIRAGGGFEVNSVEDLSSLLKKMTDSETVRSEAGALAYQFVMSNTGASAKTAKLLSEQL
ncbi:MAG: 3-deoxy-D-manno-octulosonic acid transferase [Flavobacteriia bacterium]|nr:3-deoxy-D-manno-octulosonic acid transferase [Flavobacteriia bacterium]